MRCTKHNEETNVSCGRCETPVCPKCMVHTDVGVRCRSCAPAQKKRMSRGAAALLLGGAVVAGIVVFGSLAHSSSKSSGLSSLDNLPAIDAARATADKVVDPWTPGSGDKAASPGHRFVAVEVVIENPADSGTDAYAEAYDFKLTDDKGFVYAPTFEGAAPVLGEVDLSAGQKTRGWLTFEVDQAAEVDSLTYGERNVPLP